MTAVKGNRTDYKVVRDIPQAMASGAELDSWDLAISLNGGVDRLYQSPEWLAHKLECRLPTDIERFTVFGDSSDAIGVVPTLCSTVDLSLRAGRRTFIKNTLSVRTILGNVPAIPNDAEIQEAVLRHCLSDEVHGVLVRMAPVKSQFYATLRRLATESRGLMLFSIAGPFERHIIHLPASFDEYLRQFDAKRRYNLRRQAKLLSKHVGGDVVLKQFSGPGDVDAFLDSAHQVAVRSWQFNISNDTIAPTAYWRDEYRSLANRRMFKSFVLYVGSIPVAFCVGIEYDGIYYFDTTAFDPSYASCSPGSVLLFSMLEELYKASPRTVSVVNFGYGDYAYKRSFGNVHDSVVELVLLKRSVESRWKTSIYKAFRRCATLIRRFH